VKRSEINAIMRSADEFIRAHGFLLPPFAYWAPQDWTSKGPEVREIVEHMLGWDITDFGSGDFRKIGLFLFTVRNGSPAGLRSGKGKPYAEKIMIVEEKQVTPFHFHWSKMEDIINRGGGELVIQVYNSTPEEELDRVRAVTLSVDGVERTIPAGGFIRLQPGESVTLVPYNYHTFWAEGGRTLVGEVSVVNDDTRDNRFYEPVGRFPEIEEDEPPLYLLGQEYRRFWNPEKL
jgi:D-lyxose ketol-isomerase